MKERTILHYDMDCFYAAIEFLDKPHLKNKPVVVGTNIVTTASYPARKFGIRSAMSVFEAKKLCPNLIALPVNKEKYIKISKEIQTMVLKLTNKIEFIAFDEAYIDISDIIDKYESKEKFAKIFRDRMKQNTGLTCSVGIGFNKLSAKLASEVNKPSGQFIFNDTSEFQNYIIDKNISIIPGVGRKFKELLNKDAIFKIKDALSLELSFLVKKYGNSRGAILYCAIRGIDHAEVNYEREIHSIGNENTFSIALENITEIERELNLIFEFSYNRLVKKKLKAKGFGIKVKYKSFKQFTKTKSIFKESDNKELFKDLLEDLISDTEIKEPVRLLGVFFTNISNNSMEQLTFF